MSPSSTNPPVDPFRKNSTGHSRHNSTASPQLSADPPSTSRPVSGSQDTKKRPPRYTVFIRLPFRRDEFEDPPPVEWDAAKDTALWKIIAKANSKEVDWEELASRFQVTLPFLLQQAAYLYDRQFEAMRGIVSRLGAAGPGSAMTSRAQVDGAFSGTAGLPGVGGVAMQRTGSRESRGASSTATAIPPKSSQVVPSASDTVHSPTIGGARAGAPTISRTPSSATVTQSKIFTTSAANPLQRARRGLSGSGKRPQPPASVVTGSSRDEYSEDVLEHEGGSSSDSDDEPPMLSRSRFPHRPPPRASTKQSAAVDSSDGDAEGEGDDDDNDSNDGFLPFAAGTTAREDHPSATREVPLRQLPTSSRPGTAKNKPKEDATSTTDTAASSASSMSRHFSSDGGLEPRQAPGPLSPHHRAQLASLSPRSRTQGSEGSPSMGSSFSDLDDISQSALDDAVLSNMRQGGSTMASRMSTLRDALGRRNN